MDDREPRSEEMRALACFVAAALACAPAAALAQDAQTRGIQEELLRNPETASQIIEMQDDPAVQSILSDPETMRAVQSGDLDALLSNPKIRAMMADPRVRGMSQGMR
jgi:hypothetical protein